VGQLCLFFFGCLKPSRTYLSPSSTNKATPRQVPDATAIHSYITVWSNTQAGWLESHAETAGLLIVGTTKIGVTIKIWKVQIAAAKTNKYAVTESGDTLEVVRTVQTAGLSVVLADGQTSGRGAKAVR